MTGLLCVGRDPEWWTPGHEQARLAMLICGRCTGCPDNDPAPHGVIRAGVPYFDSGRTMPICGNCGRPNTTYRGGELGICGVCAVPDVPIPSAQGSRTEQIVQLTARGLKDREIGAELGLRPESVRKLRRKAKVLVKKPARPVPDLVAV